jgi:DNA polymerase III subunit epsilon
MRFIAFDLETTGFVAGSDRIVEIGAVKFNNDAVEAIFSTLVQPNKAMPSGASKVNGIYDKDLIGKPLIEDLLKPFTEFCEDLILVAHNAPFDTQFLTADITKHESPAPNGIILDTLSIARKVYPGLPNYKLGTLVQHLDIPAGEFHRAEVDASYCGQLFYKMMVKMTGTNEMPSIENLVKLTGKPQLELPQITPQPKQLNFLDML